MPLHRESRLGIREPQTIRPLEWRERRAPKRRQLVTDCHQLKTIRRRVSQSVTMCYRLKTVYLCICQLVTTGHRLKISLNLGNLTPSP
jgi:hypothetical protein